MRKRPNHAYDCHKKKVRFVVGKQIGSAIINDILDRKSGVSEVTHNDYLYFLNLNEIWL